MPKQLKFLSSEKSGRTEQISVTFHGNPGSIENVKKFDIREGEKRVGLQALAMEKSCKRREDTMRSFPASLSKATAVITHKPDQSTRSVHLTPSYYDGASTIAQVHRIRTAGYWQAQERS